MQKRIKREKIFKFDALLRKKKMKKSNKVMSIALSSHQHLVTTTKSGKEEEQIRRKKWKLFPFLPYTPQPLIIIAIIMISLW